MSYITPKYEPRIVPVRRPPTACETILVVLSVVALVLTFPLSIWFCFITAKVYQRIIIFRLGRLRGNTVYGPGLVFLLPCVDQYERVDMRTQSFNVTPQEILTRDSVTIHVDGVVYYNIGNPLRSVLQIQNVRQSTKFLAQTTLRNVVGTRELVELLTDKDTLSKKIEQIMDENTMQWGVKTERVDIKQIHLPNRMQRAMAAEREAEREAQAKVAAANGELAASRNLKEASEVIKSNPIALQLRYLQTLNTISTENNHTIVIPLPQDLITKTFNAVTTQRSA